MNVRRKTKRILWISIPILAFLLLFTASFVYLESYYHADLPAIEAFSVERTVEEHTLAGGDTVFDPGNAQIGLIFYPGGKVEHTAYAPLMRAIAADGILCILCRMPFRLAVFDLHAADDVREAFPDVAHWYIGGHSLGGVIASAELSEHTNAYDGLFLLGAYAANDLSKTAIRALSIRGSEDRVLDGEKYEQNRNKLPEETSEVMIEGGCHACFGMYGAQRGDGIPKISNAEQIRIVAAEILAWIRKGDTRA